MEEGKGRPAGSANRQPGPPGATGSWEDRHRTRARCCLDRGTGHGLQATRPQGWTIGLDQQTERSRVAAFLHRCFLSAESGHAEGGK